MPNWWDNIQNGLGQAYMPNYGSLDPNAQQQANQQAMMQLGAGLLANSTKRPGEALGRSLGGLQQAGTQAMQAQAMAETMNDRRDERERRRKLNQTLSGMLGGGDQQSGMQQGQPPSTAFQQNGAGVPQKNIAAAQLYYRAGMPEKALEALTQNNDVNWTQATTDEGVFMVNPRDVNQRIKIGERPQRNEGEGREFSQEDKLRSAYIKQAKPFEDLRTNYQRILAASSDNTGAGDIALVYSYMKMLDPTSVVREGEFATAEQAGGVPTRIVTMYNRLISGERLSPEVRDQFKNQADLQFEQQYDSYENIRNTYRALASQYEGLDPDRVAPDLSFGVKRPQRKKAAPSQRPQDVPQAEWDAMTDEEKALWNQE